MDRYFHDLDGMNDLYDLDQIDGLYARLDRVEPPAGLAGRVLAAAAARSRRRRRLGYGIIATCLAIAAALSFFIGQQFQVSGALSLVSLLFTDMDLLTEAPLEMLLTVTDLVPWVVVIPITASLGIMAIATRFATTPSVRFSGRQSGR